MHTGNTRRARARLCEGGGSRESSEGERRRRLPWRRTVIQVASGRGWGGWRRYCEEEWPVAEAVDGAAASLICRPVDEVEPGGGADWERPT